MRYLIAVLAFALSVGFSGLAFAEEGGDAESVEICIAGICMPAPQEEGGDAE